MKKIRVYRAGRVRTLKPEVALDVYLASHPDAIRIRHVPSMEELEEWESEGVCETIDGCQVEPDGTCEHGFPSWLLALGYI